ncbi:MAG: alcohol dehydrogenase catalytic domain-containing protein [Clostridiales bacterium]|nr:alcohol dehydrogenase catalytic domain-containing protein [Clostridiales bacterium]
MKAYRIHSPHTIKLEEMDAMPVGENCVKLKNLMCSITPIDLAVYEGRREARLPIIPVRQCVGFVSEVGESVTGIARGNRVVTYSSASCHNCKACKDGRFYDCEKPSLFGANEDGFLSDFSVVSANDVYLIPDRLKDEEAIFIENIALALNALSHLQVEKGDQLVIMGATVDGIILAQVAMYYQAVPIVVDMNEEMLSLAQKAGVYFTVNAVNEDARKKILSLTGGRMASSCAYLTSSDMPVSSICDYTARRGKVAIIGRATKSDLPITVSALLEKNLDMFTVVDCGKNYQTAINLLANHTVQVESLYEQIADFDNVPEIYDRLCANGTDNTLKTLIKIK